VLPDRKPWDHAIELEAGAKHIVLRFHPALSDDKQAQLDIFIEENLASGRIRPSKSPMAAPVSCQEERMDLCRLVRISCTQCKDCQECLSASAHSDLIIRIRGSDAILHQARCPLGCTNNVRMMQGQADEWKAAFRTNRIGLFEPLVMFFSPLT